MYQPYPVSYFCILSVLVFCSFILNYSSGMGRTIKATFIPVDLHPVAGLAADSDLIHRCISKNDNSYYPMLSLIIIHLCLFYFIRLLYCIPDYVISP